MDHLILQQQFLTLLAHKLSYLRCFSLDKLVNTQFPAGPYLNSQLLPKDSQSTVNREHKVLGWEGPMKSLITKLSVRSACSAIDPVKDALDHSIQSTTHSIIPHSQYCYQKG